MKSRPFLGTVSSFREAFPDVMSVCFEGKELGDFSRTREDVSTITPKLICLKTFLAEIRDVSKADTI